MIEVDGKAVPLKPGRHYLIIVDIRYSSPAQSDALIELLGSHRIGATIYEIQGPVDAVRVVQVEQAETLDKQPLTITDTQALELNTAGWLHSPSPDGRLLWRSPEGDHTLGTHLAWCRLQEVGRAPDQNNA